MIEEAEWKRYCAPICCNEWIALQVKFFRFRFLAGSGGGGFVLLLLESAAHGFGTNSLDWGNERGQWELARLGQRLAVDLDIETGARYRDFWIEIHVRASRIRLR